MRSAIFPAPRLAIIFLLTIAAPARAEIDTDLRSWILQNVFFQKDEKGNERLFLRKNQVRAHIGIDDPEIADEARTIIANFSQAYGLEYRFTSIDINLMVFTTKDIADGNNHRISMLRSLGFTEQGAKDIVNAKDITPNSDGWSDGCGAYVSRDEKRGNDLIFSLAVAEKSRPKDRQRLCMASTITMSFGLRLRSGNLFGSRNNYVPFLLLGRSAKECDKEIAASINQSSSREKIVECIVEKLKMNFDP